MNTATSPFKYDEPAATYHASNAIGSSRAKLAITSLQLFKDSLDGIVSFPDRPVFQIGRLAHTMVLEPAKFDQLVVTQGPINPNTSEPYGRSTKAFAQWQQDNPDVTVVEPWLYRMLDRMPAEVRSIFDRGHPEVSVRTTNDLGLHVQCRPDWIHNTQVWDLKTIDDIADIDRTVRRYHYWFSQEWYRNVLRSATGLDHSFTFIFCEKKPPHRWRIVPLSEEFSDIGAFYAQDVMARIAEAQNSGDWSDKKSIHYTCHKLEWFGIDGDEL